MKKILLIEDDAVMRENTAEILGLAGYAVTTAANGKAGVEQAKAVRPDLIVCDIMMPVLDGYGVLHILAKTPELAAVPFIFLTARTEKSDLRKGMELGADDYITKPFEEAELLSAIESRLKKAALFQKNFSEGGNALEQFWNTARGLDELKTLSQHLPLMHYQRKDVVFHEGDKPHSLYFLQSGKVKISKTHADGKEYVTDLCKAGDFFGDVALLQNQPYLDTATVLEDAQVYKIPKDDFLSLISKNRDVAASFIKMLAGRVSAKEDRLLSLAYDTVRKKVAEALLLLETRYREANAKTFKIAIPREDLAGIAGTATESVIRSLSEFKSQQLIDIQGREIIILNRDGLQRVT